jgi:hypothetical protein
VKQLQDVMSTSDSNLGIKLGILSGFLKVKFKTKEDRKTKEVKKKTPKTAFLSRLYCFH